MTKLSIILWCLITSIIFQTSNPKDCSHPFYFGWVDIQCSVHQIRIIVKLFLNDTEACMKKYHPQMDLYHSPDTLLYRYCKEYFEKHFSITNKENKKIPVRFTGYRTQEEFCFFYAEAKGVFQGEHEIYAAFLMDGIPQQNNIIRISCGGNSQTCVLSYSDRTCKTVFSD